MNITLAQAIIGGVSVVLASWFTGSAGASKQLSTVDTKVEIVKTTEELHYKELKELLLGIKSDINRIAPPTIPKTTANETSQITGRVPINQNGKTN